MRLLWAAEWRSENELDGVTRHLIQTPDHPCVFLFRTRKACQAWIRHNYGYIAKRPDLRREPHGWRMPQPVRVEVRKLKEPK